MIHFKLLKLTTDRFDTHNSYFSFKDHRQSIFLRKKSNCKKNSNLKIKISLDAKSETEKMQYIDLKKIDLLKE